MGIKLLAGLCMLAFIQVSCINEGMSPCPGLTHLYIIAQGNFIDKHIPIDGAVVYLFNRNREYIRQIEVSGEEISNHIPVPLSYASGDLPYAVVWANVGPSHSLTQLIPGMTVEEVLLSLQEEEEGYLQHPGNLFYGMKQLSGLSEEEVIITPKTGRINVTVRGLPEAEEEDDESYFFSIDSHYNGYDFCGSPIAGKNKMKSSAIFNGQHELITPQPDNLIHYPVTESSATRTNEPEVLKLNLYEKIKASGEKKLIVSTDKDIAGNYIIPQPGKTINILIFFDENGDAQVSIVLTDWNEVHQWTEW